MFKIPLAQLKEKIVQSGKITSKDLDTKIKEKINDLSGLISEEGAAHIIANELGIQAMSADQAKLKIKEIYAGMRSVVTAGKVVRKFDVREFAKGDNKGKVASLIVGDDTATIRVVFWNDQVDLFNKVSEGDIIAVKEAYVRENNNNKELHLGDKAIIEINPAGEVITVVRQTATGERKKIGSLAAGEDGCEIIGTIVQVFDPRFWNVCPQCNKKVTDGGGKFQCGEHGTVNPGISYVLNVIVDDGSGNIRTVLWKNQTNQLLGKTEADIFKFKENITAFEEVKTDLLGEQCKMTGRVQRNDMFDRLEFNAQTIERARVEEELRRLEK